MTMTYIGKKVPKEFEELAGSIHLGRGVWMFNVRLKEGEHDIRTKGCQTKM